MRDSGRLSATLSRHEHRKTHTSGTPQAGGEQFTRGLVPAGASAHGTAGAAGSPRLVSPRRRGGARAVAGRAGATAPARNRRGGRSCAGRILAPTCRAFGPSGSGVPAGISVVERRGGCLRQPHQRSPDEGRERRLRAGIARGSHPFRPQARSCRPAALPAAAATRRAARRLGFCVAACRAPAAR